MGDNNNFLLGMTVSTMLQSLLGGEVCDGGGGNDPLSPCPAQFCVAVHAGYRTSSRLIECSPFPHCDDEMMQLELLGNHISHIWIYVHGKGDLPFSEWPTMNTP